MMPQSLVRLESLPRTPQGKVDRKALSRLELSPSQRPVEAMEVEAARTPVEEILEAIWAEMLGRQRVGRWENFFELGGHSLLATRVISRVREVFQREIPLRALFESPTLADFATVVEKAMQRERGLEIPPIQRVPRDGVLPLSFAQQRLWFLDQLDPLRPDYNVPLAVRLRGALNPSALVRALSDSLRRHEILRTTFDAPGGDPVQIVHPPAPLAMPIIDLRFLSAAARDNTAGRLSAEESLRPFSLSRGPLLRALLLRLADADHVLLLTLHHIVSDEWSRGILVQEVTTLYEACADGRPASLPELSVQYADYAAWQRRWLCGEALESQVAYWRQRLAGSESLLALPTDRPRKAVQSSRGHWRSLALDRELQDRLASLGREAGTTSFMTLLAAFQVLLAAYSGQESISVGTPVAGRNRVEVEGLIGFFVNTLVMCLDVHGDRSFRQLLDRMRETALGAYMHQDLPFEKLVDELQPERDLSHSPLFQVMFAIQNVAFEERTLRGLELCPFEPPAQIVKFDLMLAVAETASGLVAVLGYRTDLFDASTAARLLSGYTALLERIAMGSDLPLSALAGPLAAERHQMLLEWNDTAVEPGEPQSLHRFFERQAERVPQALAVVCGEARWSYGELDERASRLAGVLRGLGVGSEVAVGVCVERGFDMVVALLGVLKAGGFYLPLDPAYPQERLAFMLEDCGAGVLLSQQRLLAALPEHRARVVRLDVEEDWRECAAAVVPAGGGELAGRLAYVIYTSGSTGRPKGVGIEHRSAVELVRWAREVFAPAELAGVFAATSICFDLSVFELFVPLSWGGAVILGEEALHLPSHPAAARVTLVNMVPSAMEGLLRSGPLPASVRTVNLAGEPISRDLVGRVYAQEQVARLLNLYGPSEDTTYSTGSLVGRDGGSVRIGRPVRGTRAYLLDAGLRPVPLGAVGELFLGGSCRSRSAVAASACTGRETWDATAPRASWNFSAASTRR
jgi:amino acid adenylation domain-containing protein